MKSNKLRILALAIVAVLAPSTCVYAANSKDDDDYTKDELNNLTPGFDWKDMDRSNYRVSSFINSFSSAQTPKEKYEEDDEDDDSTTTTSTTNSTIGSEVGNSIVSTAPSTGNKGDFWGKTSDGKWILLEQGVPVSGWRMVRGKWYYMDADGVMQTGWINDNGTWYYLNSGGDMAYNTIVDGLYVNWDGSLS